MSQKHSPAYTLVFVAVISVICAGALAITADLLKDRIKANEKLEVQKSILESFALFKTDKETDRELPRKADVSKSDVDKFFEERLVTELVDIKGQRVESAEPIEKIKPWRDEKDKGRESVRLPIYKLKKPGSDEIVAYCFPIWGKGLWGPIYGYLAIDRDLRTIRGVTFDAPKETPGLGAEIMADAWRKTWEGKTISDAGGNLTPIMVVKGGAKVKYEGKPQMAYAVDGISGATLTCNGVNTMMTNCLELYQAYFERLKRGQK